MTSVLPELMAVVGMLAAVIGLAARYLWKLLLYAGIGLAIFGGLWWVLVQLGWVS